jgi:hypothetical protein
MYMPFRKKYTKKTKRRRAPRRRRRYSKLSQAVIPTSNIKRFRYVQDVSVDAATGASSSYCWTANGLYQPDITQNSTMAHQPYGFDQYVPTLYNHYVVLGSKLTATFTLGQPGTSVENNVVCGIMLNDSETTHNNMTLIREQGRARWTMVSPTGNPRSVSKKYSAKRFHGVANVTDNEHLGGTYLSNPNEQAYYHVFACSAAPNVNPRNVLISVVIDYICLLKEPNTFGQS